MPALDVAHLDAINLLDDAPKDLRVDHLNAVAVGPEALVADDQRQRHRIEAEDQRPFLGDDVEQSVDALGFQRRKYRLVDCADGARVAASEGDQILVGFLDHAEPLAQLRDRAFLELDHLAHAAMLRRNELISYNGRGQVQPLRRASRNQGSRNAAISGIGPPAFKSSEGEAACCPHLGSAVGREPAEQSHPRVVILVYRSCQKNNNRCCLVALTKWSMRHWTKLVPD